MKYLIHKIYKRLLKLDAVQELTGDYEKIYLPLSIVHIGLKPIIILADLQERNQWWSNSKITAWYIFDSLSGIFQVKCFVSDDENGR